jgi:hypothetical protein
MASENFEYKSFSAFITQEVASIIYKAGDRGFKEEAFTQLAMDMMSDAVQTSNTEICTAVHLNKSGNRHRKVNGYAIWDNFEELNLFITDYKGEGGLYTIDKGSVTSGFNLLLKYLQFLEKGDIETVEESSAERMLHRNFTHYKENFTRIRLIFLTDGIVKSPRKNEQVTPPAGLKQYSITCEIWDLERLYQLYSSQHKREPIEMDVIEQFRQRISCLKVVQNANRYTTYVGIVPGNFLADMYEKYGSRLLEQNVRVYLQNVGKVNKEIRKTILKAPAMFLAFNNGIAATATDIVMETDRDSGEEVIKRIKGLQIVNGGQTTSSVYYARKKDNANLSDVNVQMKITVVPDNQQMEEVVTSISKSANSQNKVSDTDLTSNQHYHIRLEELSRTTWNTSKEGIETRWYYERVKGQYKEEINREHTPSRQKLFKERNPASQVLKKEEVAKFRNSWMGLPQSVVRGSQKNYIAFNNEEKKIEPTREYFRDTIAMGIIFREAEKLYGVKPDSMGDLRYLAVPYSLAWFNHHTSGKLDFKQIWDDQAVPAALSDLLRRILLKVNHFLQNSDRQGALIGEWAKKDECWEKVKSITPQEWEIDFTAIAKLMTREVATSVKMPDADISGVSLDDWESLVQFGLHSSVLSNTHVLVVRTIIDALKKQRALSDQQVQFGHEAWTIFSSYKPG